MSQEGADGPVPVRDLLKKQKPDVPEAPAEDARWEGFERNLLVDGDEWLVRSAGAGSYGTGRVGAARLVAVHFCRASDPATPVREALVPAGRLARMHEEELLATFERATTIDLER